MLPGIAHQQLCCPYRTATHPGVIVRITPMAKSVMFSDIADVANDSNYNQLSCCVNINLFFLSHYDFFLLLVIRQS